MEKQKLLKYFDDNLLDNLFGFCYARTKDSYEAQELCSDIIFALVKAAHTDGQIANLLPQRIKRMIVLKFSGQSIGALHFSPKPTGK